MQTGRHELSKSMIKDTRIEKDRKERRGEERVEHVGLAIIVRKKQSLLKNVTKK